MIFGLEIQDLRARGEGVFAQQTSRYRDFEASLEGRLADRLLSEVETRINALAAELRQLAESDRRQMRSEIENRFEILAAATSQRLDAFGTQLNRALDEMSQSLKKMTELQASFIDETRQRMRTATRRLLLVSMGALVAAVAGILYQLAQ